MSWLEDCKEYIKKNEGWRDRTYTDTTGHATIGYGHMILKGEKFDEPISQAEGDHIFEKDFTLALSNAISLFPNFRMLPDTVKIVLVDMTYNVGLATMKTFTRFRNAIARYDFIEAGAVLTDYLYFKQVKNRGMRNVDLLIAKTYDPVELTNGNPR